MTAVGRAISRNGEELVIGRRRYDLRRYERVVVLGAGKATASMAQAVEQRLGPRLQGGFVVVKHGHLVPTRRIVVAEAGHPFPIGPVCGRRPGSVPWRQNSVGAIS